VEKEQIEREADTGNSLIPSGPFSFFVCPPSLIDRPPPPAR